LTLKIYNLETGYCIKLTLDRLKLDKSIDISEVHPRNILPIITNFDVLKLDKSNDINEVHSENISFIVITLGVSNLVKFIYFNELQP
jgi:hypothetical protein